MCFVAASSLLILVSLKGNDYDEVEAQMGMGDEEPSQIPVDDHMGDNGPSYDSGSVPPGLDGHDGPPENTHSTVNDDSGNDAHMASAPPEEHSHASPPASADVDASSAAAPASIDSATVLAAVEPAPQSADGADGSSSTQASSQETVQATEPNDPAPEVNGHDEDSHMSATQTDDDHEDHTLHALAMEPTQVLEPPPESAESEYPPPSETSSTTLDASPSTVIGCEMPPQPAKPETDGSYVPSANRLSISYAAGTRRMVIDSAIVDKLKVFRADARIEVHLTLGEEAGNLKGILVSDQFTLRVIRKMLISYRSRARQTPRYRIPFSTSSKTLRIGQCLPSARRRFP